MTILGLDIGTSAVKAVLVDDREQVLATASSGIATSRPHPLWSEQEPEDWWRAVETVAAHLGAAHAQAWRAIEAISLSGQMHGTVLLDAEDRIIRPAILWNDGRAVAESRLIEERVPGIGNIAGVKPMPGFSAPKLLWLRHHEPDHFRRIARIMLPKDYIRLRLAGEFATDMSDAAGSLWLDCGRRQWSDAIVEASGLSLAQLPRLLEGPDLSGRLRPGIARDWNLAPSVIIAAGAGDVAAGAVGIGAIAEGQAFVSLGTSAQYVIAGERYRPAPDKLVHAFCHALPGRWYQMAALLNGASCLTWAAALLHSELETLLAETEAAFSGPSELLFLPYLTGERTPHNDPDASGVISGLTPAAKRSDIMQAVLEGVALSLADCQDILEQAGTRVATLGVIGGGARNRFWMRLLAAILNRPLKLYSGAEHGPAFGAARLARLALTREDPATLCREPPIQETITPDPHLVSAYAPRLPKFRALYRHLSPATNSVDLLNSSPSSTSSTPPYALSFP